MTRREEREGQREGETRAGGEIGVEGRRHPSRKRADRCRFGSVTAGIILSSFSCILPQFFMPV